jgi:hypothetical protein
MLAATLVPGVAAPASAEVIPGGAAGVVDLDPVTGFPLSYVDSGAQKLAVCLSGLQCLATPLPNPNAPVSFPDNYPDEAFYFAADASGGNLRIYRAGLEATFATAPNVVNGAQMGFGRLRFRVENLVVGSNYIITHPYGSNTFTATDDPNKPGFGLVNQTVDAVGCLPSPGVPCNWTAVGAGFLGGSAGTGVASTFLTQSNKAPGMLGSLVVPGTVTGAPSGLNAVTVTGPNAGGTGINTLTVADFNVQGLIAGAATLAGRPIIKVATAANGSAVGNWSAAGNGGSAITRYHVRVVDAATGTKVFALRDTLPAVGKSANSLNVTGLPNGITVRIQVQAINAQGTGPVSNASNAVTPATVPSKPTIQLATAGIASATGHWTATSNGGAVIMRYHVRVVDAATGTKVFVLRDVAGSARSVTVGLGRGTAVRFQVQAINGVGTSPISNHSNAVTAR